MAKRVPALQRKAGGIRRKCTFGKGKSQEARDRRKRALPTTQAALPTKAGIQFAGKAIISLDSRLRGNDGAFSVSPSSKPQVGLHPFRNRLRGHRLHMPVGEEYVPHFFAIVDLVSVAFHY